MTERPPSFDAEVLACVSALRGFAYNLTKNHTRADDVVQSTILKALEKWEQYEPGTNLKAWLFTIERNIVYDTHRRTKREVEDPEGVYSLQLTTQPDQIVMIEYRETMRGVRELDGFQRKCLLLIADGYTYEQVAEMMHTQPGTVKSRVSRARTQLDGLEREEEQVAPPLRVDRALVVDLFKAGATVSEICERLKADRAEVRNITMEVPGAWRKRVSAGA